MIFGPNACLRRSGSRISGQKAIPGPKNKRKMKNSEQTWIFFGGADGGGY